MAMFEDTPAVKRPRERKRIQMAVTVVVEGEEAEHLATTVDVSPYGVRVQSDATLAPGQPVGLLLSSQPEYFIKARVVWVGRADTPQAGQAGFEFLNPLSGPVC